MEDYIKTKLIEPFQVPVWPLNYLQLNNTVPQRNMSSKSEKICCFFVACFRESRLYSEKNTGNFCFRLAFFEMPCIKAWGQGKRNFPVGGCQTYFFRLPPQNRQNAAFQTPYCRENLSCQKSFCWNFRPFCPARFCRYWGKKFAAKVGKIPVCGTKGIESSHTQRSPAVS